MVTSLTYHVQLFTTVVLMSMHFSLPLLLTIALVPLCIPRLPY